MLDAAQLKARVACGEFAQAKRTILLQFAERFLWLLGLLLVGVAALNLASYYAFQKGMSVPRSAYAAERGSRARSKPLRVLDRTAVRVAGRLDIPRLGVSLLVADGDEEEALSVGAAHLLGTPEPGSPGNSVIAGHRDTAFWPLRKLVVGDIIRIRSPQTHRYIVRSIRIVEPDDTSVLDGNSAPILTLITCYPFRFVGTAPRRFVVRAELTS